MRRAPALLAALSGCTFVVGREWDRVRDADGDGAIAERFGGPDCRDDDPELRDCDADGDGVRAIAAGGEDCDDDDAGAGAFVRRYEDRDGDGHGDPARAGGRCGESPGWSADADDCDDGDAEVFPGADERCDALDRDCDGDPTRGAVDGERWPRDRDGDGFGDPAAGESAATCAPPAGFAGTLEPDCDDRDPAVSPIAPEVPWNGVDDDCDGGALEDVDGDGADGVEGGGPDCDDRRAAIRPGAEERCNGVDDDCDGRVDAGAVDTVTWWPDADGDGHGDAASAPEAWCLGAEPPGRAPTDTDCDDRAGDVFPGAPESCDDRDEDCDGLADEGATDALVAFHDFDGDGFGGAAVRVCGLGPGVVDDDSDCDDTRADTHPGAREVCGDGVRQDCREADLADCDADGALACAAPGETGCDCLDDPSDPRAPAVFPAFVDPAGVLHDEAPESCNGLDDDCDGFADDADPDDVVPESEWPRWYLDADGDGAPGPIAVGQPSCAPPEDGSAPLGPQDVTDCDDSRDSAFPGAPERCNGLDDDCDGAVDESADPATAPRWYPDGDGDGFGGGAGELACAAPGPTSVAVGGDCDDARADTSPGAPERCNARDDDCDGVVDAADVDLDRRLYPDGDGDGFGVDALGLPSCAAAGPGTAGAGGDCDDADGAVSPAAPERCDGGRDDDCDGLADEDDPDLADATTVWPDRDHDGAGDQGAPPVSACGTDGYALAATDCDDADPGVGPGAPERCGGGDEDCDGLEDDADPSVVGAPLGFLDLDGDGVPGTLAVACAAVTGTPDDCDDGRPEVFPGAPEDCDGVDDDCDGVADDAPAAGGEVLFPDDDGDGFGDADAAPSLRCVGSGWVSAPRATDCDDAHGLVFPGAPELCDGGDTDCDGDPHDAPGEGYRYVDADRDGVGSDVLAWQCAGSGATTSGDPDDADPAIGGCDTPTWVDGDGDGWGGAATTVCGPDPGIPPGDCDDGDAERFPGASDDDCDGVDQDCDGTPDDAALLGYLDPDGDGYGTGSLDCAGTAPDAGDCAEGDPSVNPGATEICGNGVDEDCDAATADACNQASGSVPCWPDLDCDGYGDLDVVPTLYADACPPGTTPHPLDCVPNTGTPVLRDVAADELQADWTAETQTCVLFRLQGDQALTGPLTVPTGKQWRVLGTDTLVTAPATVFALQSSASLVLDGLRVETASGAAVAISAPGMTTLGVVSGSVTTTAVLGTGVGVQQGGSGRVTLDGVVVTGFGTGVSAAQEAAIRRTEVRSGTTGVLLTGAFNQSPRRTLERVLAIDNVTGVKGYLFTATHLTAAGNTTGVEVLANSTVTLNVTLTDSVLAHNALDLDNADPESGSVEVLQTLVQDDYQLGGLNVTVAPVPDPAFWYASPADAALWDVHVVQRPCSAADDTAGDGDDRGYYPNTDPAYESLDTDGLPDDWEALFFGGPCDLGDDCAAYDQCREPI